ncbi:MAG: proline--tRNA ligase [Patescibacteria group bacterium]|nr:proline--tRNA ligase [Patescibacteria group bacterium]
MKQSQLFCQTSKQASKDAETISQQYLTRGSYIDQLSAGIWTILPLGLKVFRKIENIIRHEMNKIGGQELFLPTLQPKRIWLDSGRWNKMEPPLFKLKDIHKKEFALGSTHEEVITDLVKKYLNSYKQLPFALYQIQNKFRNEIRVTGGLLRVKEFIMKDLYSFHATKEDLDNYYKKVLQAYKNIFKRLKLKAEVVEAQSGSIGGDFCHEFMVLADSGEDKILICQDCNQAINKEASTKKTCRHCQGKMKEARGIEAAHIFKLNHTYSKKMGATFTNKEGREKYVYMGCYGIGIGRLMASIVEACHDQYGIIWPSSVTPYKVHLLNLSKTSEYADKIYEKLLKNNIDVLYDDRDVSSSYKLKDADLMGISTRAVISDKNGQKIEIKKRKEKKANLFSLKNFIKQI